MPEARGALRIRVAAPHDLYAAHAFLPWIATAAVPLDAIVVAENDAGLCGIGALSTTQTAGALRVWISVHETARRQGAGSALLHGLADVARAWGASRLRTWRPTDAESALAFLAHAGAEAPVRLLSFEASPDLAAFRGRLGRRADAASSDVRPLSEADLPQIARLYAAHLGDTPHVAIARLRAMLANPLASALSLAFERRGAMRAFVICQPDDDGTPRVDFWYADPTVRGSSALALIALGADRFRALGGTRMRFQCRDDARSTLRLARESGATLVRTETSHELVL